VVASLVCHERTRDAAQFRVDRVGEPIGGLGVPGCGPLQEQGDFARWFHVCPLFSADPAYAGMTPPEQLFVTNLPTIEALVQMVGRQQRMTWAEAEEFASIVRLRLIENDYAILRKFRGGSSLRTYLTVVIARQALDYRDACWGRWRPSRAARRLGHAAVALERLIVRDGMTFDDAWRAVPDAPAPADAERLRAFAACLQPRLRRHYVSLDDLDESRAGTTDPEVENIMRDHRVAAALAGALRTLPPADSRLLRLRFSEGLSISSIARREGIDQASLYRRVAGLLRRLRRDLEARGIAAPAM
jgi:RNA polymerase sigma factor for flagellar operon FliA